MNTETTTQAIWRALTQTSDGETFDPEQLAGLTEPAKRYLLHAIQPGTPLASSCELTMDGTFCLSPRGWWLPMSSSEIIAAGQGFMWKAKMGYLLPIIGFDRYSAGVGEMSWRLGGLIPVAQAQGADVSRSARGRFVVELLLLPSALLPGPQVTWKELGENRAQVRVALDGETTLMELELRSDGRPKRAIVQRWSNFGSADGEWGFVPFAVNIEEEHCFGGYTIPTRLAAGWWGEDGWRFEFFRVEITQALFR